MFFIFTFEMMNLKAQKIFQKIARNNLGSTETNSSHPFTTISRLGFENCTSTQYVFLIDNIKNK